MAKSSDPARRRLRSLSDVISSARTAATAVRHWLAFSFTVAELVALGSWRNFGSVREVPPELAASVHEAVAAVGLSTVINRPIAELSVGQFQRALFARMLLQDADIILLDEPFASLDENTTENLLRFLQRWREEGRTIVAVLHDLDRV